MLAYIVKRLLLMIPTLLGVLLLTFAVIQFVPGGPVEQYLAEAKAGAGGAGAETGGLSYRGRRGSIPSGLRPSRPCMALTSRRMSASCKCSVSLPASILAKAFSKQGRH